MRPIRLASGSEIFPRIGLTCIFTGRETMSIKGQVSRSTTLAMLVLASSLPCFAQDGKLTIHATPKQAYVFLDDHAVGEASRNHSLKLSPGDHKVELVNYGYTPVTRTVTHYRRAGHQS
jgi:PEGA domain